MIPANPAKSPNGMAMSGSKIKAMTKPSNFKGKVSIKMPTCKKTAKTFITIKAKTTNNKIEISASIPSSPKLFFWD